MRTGYYYALKRWLMAKINFLETIPSLSLVIQLSLCSSWWWWGEHVDWGLIIHIWLFIHKLIILITWRKKGDRNCSFVICILKESALFILELFFFKDLWFKWKMEIFMYLNLSTQNIITLSWNFLSGIV